MHASQFLFKLGPATLLLLLFLRTSMAQGDGNTKEIQFGIHDEGEELFQSSISFKNQNSDEPKCSQFASSYQISRDNALSLSMTVPASVKQNEEALLKLTVTNNVNKCMAVKISTEDNASINYPEGHFVYTACVCRTHNYYWDITVSESTVITGMAEVISDEKICPPSEKLYSAVGDQVFVTVPITVTE